MTQLLDDVMLISKAEMGQLDCHPTRIDIVQFCRDLVDELHPENISNHHIAFVSQSNIFYAYLDEKLLRHILSNLLSNAIKYSPYGGTINFRLGYQLGEVVFQIHAPGIGIPITEFERLSSSFYRGSNVGTISVTELGLAIVKKAVNSYQGRINVESKVGFDTTFLVYLPLKKEKYMNKILVIEDEFLIREYLLERLDSEGFDAIGAENGLDGVKLALAERPDLTICDVMMPELDGCEVLKTLRQNPILPQFRLFF